MKYVVMVLMLWNVFVTSMQEIPELPSGLGTTHFIVPADAKSIPPQGSPFAQKPKKAVQKKKSCVSYGPFTCNPDGSLRQVFFSPDEQVREKLIYLIDHEREEIKVAVFTMTERSIADAFVRALQRGVRLSIVVDPVCIRDRSNKVGLLCEQGVCTYVYNPQHITKGLHGCMHHKFAIFNKNIGNRKILWTGSFNFTRAASLTNHENALVLDDREIVARFEECFNGVQNKSYRYKSHKKNHAQA